MSSLFIKRTQTEIVQLSFSNVTVSPAARWLRLRLARATPARNYQKVGRSYERPTFWCRRSGLNRHGLPHGILNPARLPIPPRRHIKKFRIIPLPRQAKRDARDGVSAKRRSIFAGRGDVAERSCLCVQQRHRAKITATRSANSTTAAYVSNHPPISLNKEIYSQYRSAIAIFQMIIAIIKTHRIERGE